MTATDTRRMPPVSTVLPGKIQGIFETRLERDGLDRLVCVMQQMPGPPQTNTIQVFAGTRLHVLAKEQPEMILAQLQLLEKNVERIRAMKEMIDDCDRLLDLWMLPGNALATGLPLRRCPEAGKGGLELALKLEIEQILRLLCREGMSEIGHGGGFASGAPPDGEKPLQRTTLDLRTDIPGAKKRMMPGLHRKAGKFAPENLAAAWMRHSPMTANPGGNEDEDARRDPGDDALDLIIHRSPQQEDITIAGDDSIVRFVSERE